MKAKAARKVIRNARPVRKSSRGKKHTRAEARAGKKETLQPVPAWPEIVAGAFDAPVEFVEVDLEPVIEVFEVYETDGGDGDGN